MKYELLVIGGSAGSLSIVLKIVPLLKPKMNLSVIIVFHRKQSEETILVDLLASKTDCIVKEVDDKDEITPGIIYLAPADYHVLIEKNHQLTLDFSEKVNFSRPSIDVTIETAAEAYGRHLACILLSGANADGVKALTLAKRTGALVVVQDPKSAEFPYMPGKAMERVQVDIVLNEENLEELIDSIVG